MLKQVLEQGREAADAALGIPLKDLVELTRARPGCPTGGHSSRLVLKVLSKPRATIQKRRDELDGVLRSMNRAAELVSTVVCSRLARA